MSQRLAVVLVSSAWVWLILLNPQRSPGNRAVLGTAKHSEVCAPMASVPSGGCDRNHTHLFLPVWRWWSRCCRQAPCLLRTTSWLTLPPCPHGEDRPRALWGLSHRSMNPVTVVPSSWPHHPLWASPLSIPSPNTLILCG